MGKRPAPPTCVYCGRLATCRDHIRPSARGGLNSDSNLVPSCTECNSSKGSKLITEWIPGRVLRAVAMDPRVYAELLRIRAEDERQLAARHLAAAEVAAEARAATLADVERNRRAIGLREAVALGVLPMRLEAARKARQHDPEFPKPSDTGADGGYLYDAIELRTWFAWRPRNQKRTRPPGETTWEVPTLAIAEAIKRGAS